MTNPTKGGRYVRDAKTDTLSRVDEETAAQPSATAPQTVKDPETETKTAPVVSSEKGN